MTDFKHPNDENRTIAMAYVPWQQFRNLYDLEQASGSVPFCELDKPFTEEEACIVKTACNVEKQRLMNAHLSVWLRHQ
ncbi:MAG: spore coat associated protein CotJA [Eubacterium sp.]